MGDYQSVRLNTTIAGRSSPSGEARRHATDPHNSLSVNLPGGSPFRPIRNSTTSNPLHRACETAARLALLLDRRLGLRCGPHRVLLVGRRWWRGRTPAVLPYLVVALRGRKLGRFEGDEMIELASSSCKVSFRPTRI